MSMDNFTLAAKLARKVFETGIGPGETKRLALRGGMYPDQETNRGGLCEDALIRVLAEALDEINAQQRILGES